MSIFSRPGVKLVSLAATAELAPGMHPRISIKGGRFTLIDAGGTKHPWQSLTLPVIIIGANPHRSKVYFAQGFDPSGENNVPPTCWSDNGIAPSMLVARAQVQARTCAECELGAWGSEVSFRGKNAKACNDKKKLAAIVIGDTVGLPSLVYELQVPPTSLRPLQQYADYLGSSTIPDGTRPADLSDVVTMLSFAPDDMFVLQFEAAAWIDQVGPDGKLYQQAAVDGGEAIAARIDQICATDAIEKVTGMNDVPWTVEQLGQVPHQQIAQGQVRPPQPNGPVTGPYAGPAGVPATQPQQAFPAGKRKPGSGGARPGAGRPRQDGQAAAPAPGPQPQPLRPQGAQEVIPPQPMTLERLVPAEQRSLPGPGGIPDARHAPGGPAADPGPIPSFLQRRAEPQQTAAAPAPTGQAPFVNAGAPPADIASAVQAAFNLNTRRS